ncbi:F-actin-uncapping protein LRRC16A [Bulinus truncatus]|nr:F-actin-uncapping protein LRRC16A [Bulinus truncatus]
MTYIHLCEPLLRGCQNLTVLKASKTVFTHKKTKEVVIPNSWKQFFTSACSLEYVDFSSCRLPSEALKELLIGISCNKSVKEMFLDVSSNELGGQGAAAISSCISQVKGIKTLDISNNGFDTEMKTVLLEVAKNPYLKSLCIGRNFFNIRPKNMPEVMNTIVQMLQEETCQLESLSIADSRLKADTTYIINVLGSNNSLLEIDLSGNIMGDFGARMLAKALLINTKLHKVLWDRNNVTATGFEDIAEALKKCEASMDSADIQYDITFRLENMTLKQMPIPISDVAAALGMSLKKTEIALQKIESYLLRNNSPRRFASDQVYRLQQGFLISSSQQMIDRLVVQVQDTVNILKSCGTLEVYATEVKKAELLIEDANKSKLLFCATYTDYAARMTKLDAHSYDRYSSVLVFSSPPPQVECKASSSQTEDTHEIIENNIILTAEKKHNLLQETVQQTEIINFRTAFFIFSSCFLGIIALLSTFLHLPSS